MAPAASLVPNESSTSLVQTSRTSSIPSEYRAVEPLESGLREEMQKELRRSWYNWREDAFAAELKHSWTSPPTGSMLSIDGSTTSSHPIHLSRRLLGFCNKPTVLYWAYSAQIDYHCPNFIWGCIYAEWFRCYNQAPRLDFEYFFANPVCITSTGPRTLLELLETHELFYSRTFSFLDRLRHGENERTYMNAWPDQYKLLPVCRSIIVVFDELVPVRERLVYLDHEVQRQNVVMIRTGNETGLSEPISFESIRQLALPLARPDVETCTDIDAIRVPLATAIQFIVNLQRREEAAFPESAPSTAVDQSICPLIHRTECRPATITNVDDWVDRIMEMADEKGIDNVWHARDAMSNIQAAQRGERIDQSCPYDFCGRWR